MIIGRPPLLTHEQEARLKDDLEFCLSQENATAEVIAEYLEFGKTGTVYQKLKRYHVHYYVKKFGIETSKAKPEHEDSWLTRNEYFG